eukprot:2887905-Lingulodinium_polyedra.AAC.1
MNTGSHRILQGGRSAGCALRPHRLATTCAPPCGPAPAAPRHAHQLLCSPVSPCTPRHASS